MQWLIITLSIFIVSMILTGVLIPKILLIAFRRKLFDVQDERKIHKGVVPRLGGMAFMPAIIFSICFVSGAILSLKFYTPIRYASDTASLLAGRMTEGVVLPLYFTICGLMIIYLVGLADDLIGVKYRAKFITQIFVGLMLAVGDVTVTSLSGMFGIYALPLAASWALTIFLTVFITNAINLIDGIDGLASGLSAIAMLFYGVCFIFAGKWVYSMIAFATLGTLVPFFYYNVFGNPAHQKKIFMGDTGALTVGFLLTVMAIEVSRIPDGTVFVADSLVAGFVPLAIPCLDVLRVFAHRVLRGRSPFLPDRVHIHHKFLALGVAQRPAMILIIAISVGMIGLNMLVSPAVSVTWILLLDLAVWVAVNYLLSKAIYRRQKNEHIENGYD